MRLLLLGVICLLGIPILVALASATASSNHAIRSVTFESRREPPREDFAAIARLGVSHVTLIPFGFQPGANTPSIRYNPEARWYTESDNGLRTVTSWAREEGLQVIVKPHIWVRSTPGEGQRRDKVSFATEEEWNQWEAAYTDFIMYYARLSNELEADIFVIGTELASVARQRTDFWRALIVDIRSVYSGELTYAANWWEEYEHVEFWDDLDYIGVQAYFPIYEGSDRPSLVTLVAGWEPHAVALKTLSDRFDRPILFTEIGYRSVDYAPARPWVWASRGNEANEQPDYEIQSALYEALFNAVWTEKWFSGAILWKWHASTERRSNATDFTPQNKPAEETIRNYFQSFSAE